MSAKLAVTITVYALVPADCYNERLGEIHDGIEHGLQQAGADYAPIETRRGMPGDVSDEFATVPCDHPLDGHTSHGPWCDRAAVVPAAQETS